MNEKEIKRCLSKARERIFELFAEIEQDLEDNSEVDFTLLELNVIEAIYESFGEDFHDSE